MFSIELKPNLMLITVSGFIKQGEAMEFMAAYNNKLEEINPLQTNLILDGKGLKASAQEMLPMLEACLKMYIRDNFKKIILVELESTISMMQLKKLGEATGFMDNVAVVSTVEEGLKQLI